MAWFSGDPDPAYENAQEKAFEELERKRTAAKKAEFPHESLKTDLDKLPIYTQSELDARIAEAKKELLAEIEDGIARCGMLTKNATTLCKYSDPCCSIFQRTCTWWQSIKEGKI